jgi:hypothetical protein
LAISIAIGKDYRAKQSPLTSEKRFIDRRLRRHHSHRD